MPFDDLKPTPVAWAVEYDGETITLHNSFAKAKDYAKFTRQDGIEGRVVPLYRSPPPVAVPAVEPTRQPPKPSGVNFAFALAADVVRCVAQIENERHDAATCCGGRQEPAKPVEIDGDKADVEEGWREIGPGEILQAGDEVDVGVNCRQWVPTQRGGVRIGDEEDNYRRRVAPQAQPIEITPAAASAMCERNARDALLKKIENLRAENHEQQEKILQGCLENERLRSEVKLFVPEAPQSRPAETRASRIAWATPEEELAWFKKRVKWLDGEVERLRLRPEEILSCKCAEATLAEMPEGNEHSDVLWAMLARLRGDS